MIQYPNILVQRFRKPSFLEFLFEKYYDFKPEESDRIIESFAGQIKNYFNRKRKIVLEYSFIPPRVDNLYKPNFSKIPRIKQISFESNDQIVKGYIAYYNRQIQFNDDRGGSNEYGRIRTEIAFHSKNESDKQEYDDLLNIANRIFTL